MCIYLSELPKYITYVLVKLYFKCALTETMENNQPNPSSSSESIYGLLLAHWPVYKELCAVIVDFPHSLLSRYLCKLVANVPS